MPLRSITATLSPIVFAAIYFLGSADCQAEDSTSSYKPISTYDAMHQGKSDSESRMLLLQSQAALRNEDLERAIKFGRRAVNADQNDLDARAAYGNALSTFLRLKEKTDKNYPSVRNEAIKTWLLIYRNVVGEESGTTYKGIGIPLAGTFFADSDRVGLAKDRLTEICGRTPKFWETNKKYLKKVLEPEVQVEGTILSSVNEPEKDSEPTK